MKYPEMIKIQYGSEAYEDTINIRNKYFRKPQGLSIRDEDLTGDKKVNMYGGYIDNQLMATIFYKEEDKDTAVIKAVIVDEKYRGLGYGNFLMNFIEEKIKAAGYKKAILMGRVVVEGFYKKLGYKTTSEAFDYNKM